MRLAGDLVKRFETTLKGTYYSFLLFLLIFLAGEFYTHVGPCLRKPCVKLNLYFFVIENR